MVPRSPRAAPSTIRVAPLARNDHHYTRDDEAREYQEQIDREQAVPGPQPRQPPPQGAKPGISQLDENEEHQEDDGDRQPHVDPPLRRSPGEPDGGLVV